MSKKTSTEYEAMIGGLMKRLEDVENKYENAQVNLEVTRERMEQFRLLLRGTVQTPNGIVYPTGRHVYHQPESDDVLCVPKIYGTSIVINKGETPWDALIRWKDMAEGNAAILKGSYDQPQTCVEFDEAPGEPIDRDDSNETI